MCTCECMQTHKDPCVCANLYRCVHNDTCMWVFVCLYTLCYCVCVLMVIATLLFHMLSTVWTFAFGADFVCACVFVCVHPLDVGGESAERHLILKPRHRPGWSITKDTGTILSLSCQHTHDCTTMNTVQKQHCSPDLYITSLNVKKEEELLQKARFPGKTTYCISYSLKSGVTHPYWMTRCQFNKFVQIIVSLFMIIIDDRCFMKH